MYLPKSDSGRIIVGTWWLVVLVVVTTYCGNLVAFLTFPKMEVPVNTVEELVTKKNMFTWGIRSNTFFEKYLKVRSLYMTRIFESYSVSFNIFFFHLQETDIDKYIRLNASVILHNRVSNDVVDSVKARKHVFIDWESNIQHIMRKNFLETNKCDFSMGELTILLKPM